MSGGAGTRQAPCRQASHISSQEASKATDRPASTRSRVPSGRSCRNSRASASTNAAALRCVTATPFGFPVEPEVKMIQASSFGPGSRGPMRFGGVERSVTARSAPITAQTPASPNTMSARSSASTGTYAAPTDRVARTATYRSAVPDGTRMPTRSPYPMPHAPRVTPRASTSRSSAA